MDLPSPAQTLTPEIRFLYGLQRGSTRLGLESTRHLLALLGDPETGVPVVHVAGTNGKGSVQRRLKEELDELQVQMNQEKTKVVNLREGGCFSFLGFDMRLNWNREGKTYVSKTPRMKKRKEIGRKVKAVLKFHRSRPLEEVIQAVNAVVRGWVNYFRIGNSNSTFSKVKYLIEKKVRRFVMKRKGLKGFGWKRWSKEEINEKWGLYQDYRIRYLYPKAAPSR